MENHVTFPGEDNECSFNKMYCIIVITPGSSTQGKTDIHRNSQCSDDFCHCADMEARSCILLLGYLEVIIL